MAGDGERAPWYAAGLDFACVRCGGCCAGPEEGYVWATAQEIAAIADRLGIPPEQVHQRYVRAVGGRFSLRERSDSRDCVFLAGDGDRGRGCAIYPVRPMQCRTWPFWPTNLRSADAWSQAAARCPGIDRGEHFDCDEIQARCNVTGR